MTKESQKIALVILAAGTSKRMKSCKQLLPWKHTTLIDHAIGQALKSKADRVYVVFGAHKEQVLQEISKHPVAVVVNPHWMNGMGGSISSAITRIIQDKEKFQAVLIALVDQPLVEYPHFNSLISQYLETGSLVATQFNDSTGVPALFPSEFFDKLLELKGGKGAKSIIQGQLNNTVLITENKAAIDLDTPEEYQRCFEQYGHS